MRGIGYFLGATLGAAILFFIISFIFLRPRTVDETLIYRFVQNSDYKTISLVPYVGGILSDDDERLGIDIISKMTYFSNRNMSYVRAETYTYFSDDYGKFIKIFVINESAGVNSSFLAFGKKEKDPSIWPDIITFYNKTQNADPTFGTIDKPLPILHFRSSNPALRSMRSNNRDADPDYLKMVYEENVKLYLEYFIDKEDFKKLFPES